MKFPYVRVTVMLHSLIESDRVTKCMRKDGLPSAFSPQPVLGAKGKRLRAWRLHTEGQPDKPSEESLDGRDPFRTPMRMRSTEV